MFSSFLRPDFTAATTPYAQQLLPALKEGDIRAVRHYWNKHRGHMHLRSDVWNAFEAICASPNSFSNLDEGVEILLEEGISPVKVFQSAATRYGEDYTERSFWLSYALSKDRSQQRGYAVLLAEYLRYRLGMAREPYKVSPSDLLHGQDVQRQGAGIMRGAGLVAFKTVQHALVAYVNEAGPNLPLTRGAALLDQLRDIPGAELWTRRIASIEDNRVCQPHSDRKHATVIHYEKA